LKVVNGILIDMLEEVWCMDYQSLKSILMI
jgi:hypothetical protein